jgi:4-diphosphocytidyl-2-C-methyl-D-erythritol kinase
LEKISLKAPAKINLYLRVLGERDDGYHEIESLMQAVDIYDEITLERSDVIEMTCDDPALPVGDSNLAFKAALAMQNRFYFPGIRINLKKRIPSGSGLGGGSSDAASVLRGLCRLYGLSPSPDEMLEMSSEVGSDVPFFLSGGQALVTGRGEKIRPIFLPRDYGIVVIVPSVTSSTAEAYAGIRISLTKSGPPTLLEKRISTSRFERLIKSFSNDLEEVVLRKFPEFAELKRTLAEAGAQLSSMTGSGSAFFGLFPRGGREDFDLGERLGIECRLFHCRPILLSPYLS